jgi:Protein of unknown function (DUF3014)
MADLDDFKLDEEGSAEDLPGTLPPPPPGPPPGLLAGGALLVAALGAGAFFLLRRPAPPPLASAPPPALSLPPAASLSPAQTERALPPLAESDAFVRELAQGLSAHPLLAAWLEARGLVRTFAASVLNIAEGRSPAGFVPFLAPGQKFAAVERGGRLVADPRYFQAYDGMSAAVTSLDTAGVVRVYRTLLPLLGAAYKELGYPDADFTLVTERAIAHLLATPLPAGEIPLRKDSLFLRYADPRLEGLSLAQKQLLRTGPANAKRLQEKLRELYREFGFTPHS